MTKQEEPDIVNHPSHYRAGDIPVECIVVVEHFNFNLGNVIKYIWRTGKKDPDRAVEDLQKAQWYLKREIERLGGDV